MKIAALFAIALIALFLFAFPEQRDYVIAHGQRAIVGLAALLTDAIGSLVPRHLWR